MVVCNICGKAKRALTTFYSFEKDFAYGSKFDGDVFSIDLCPECFDKFAKDVNEVCKYPAIVDVGCYGYNDDDELKFIYKDSDSPEQK